MSEAPDRIWVCVSKNTKSGVVTLLGDATFPVDGWQEYIRADRIEAQAAEIERLKAALERGLSMAKGIEMACLGLRDEAQPMTAKEAARKMIAELTEAAKK